MMKAFTSTDDNEIRECVAMLLRTDAGTGFMHESFHVDDPSNFTREWFAWQNTLFGELILKLVNEGKADLLNSIPESGTLQTAIWLRGGVPRWYEVRISFSGSAEYSQADPYFYSTTIGF